MNIASLTIAFRFLIERLKCQANLHALAGPTDRPDFKFEQINVTSYKQANVIGLFEAVKTVNHTDPSRIIAGQAFATVLFK